ncbi:MAG: Uma2 family endonuclease [Firmicutes bacterium]|nr:Uma2 family endonuclease [Bacillota bacterium]
MEITDIATDIALEQFFTRMATMPRHGDLVAGFLGELWQLKKSSKNVRLFGENTRLAYSGEIYSEMFKQAKLIQNPQDLSDEHISELACVMPDIMLFNGNLYVEKRSKIVGCPNLIVEIWSDSNTIVERKLKTLLYSTSPTTEHWYLEQNSNIVKRKIGGNKLASQNLTEVLRTESGVLLDLRGLAV